MLKCRKRIYLLGFMGAGKSYIGKLLAQELNYNFIDLDNYIVEQSPFKDIPEIFAQKGESYFRKLERSALMDSQNWDKVVVATGGGSPCQKDNIQLILEAGFSIFLDPPTNALIARLKNEAEQRPLLKEVEEEQLQNFVLNLLEKRKPYYKQADWIIHSSKKDAIIQQIIKKLETI